jgi:hypothetical protein
MPEHDGVPEAVLEAYRRVRDAERGTDEQELVQQDPGDQRVREQLRRHDPRGDDQPTAEAPGG